MEIDYSGLEHHRPDLMPSVREASELLKAEIGPSVSDVRAKWGIGADNQGRHSVDLELSDWTGSVGYRFAPDELAKPRHMKLRLHRLWGDLLMVQSHAHLDRLNWQLSQYEGQ